jgi:hypothetical protein
MPGLPTERMHDLREQQASKGADAAGQIEFLWTYDDTCTHFIYPGKLADADKELQVAKEGLKVILSADWLFECKEEVDEALFLVGGSTKECASISGMRGETATGNEEKAMEALEGSACDPDSGRDLGEEEFIKEPEDSLVAKCQQNGMEKTEEATPRRQLAISLARTGKSRWQM